MELRQLSHFLAVVEARNFTRAAERVHLTQSSLSSSVRALERELGTALFARSTRRVALTESGRALLDGARRTVRAADDARDAVAAVQRVLTGTLAIGVIQTVGGIDLPALLARFRRRHPGVALRLHNDSVNRLLAATIAGELDLAFVDHTLGDHAGQVDIRPLGTEPLVLAVALNDPLAAARSLHLTDLHDRDFIEYRADSALRARIDTACEQAGLRRHSPVEVGTIADLTALVAHGVGVALLPPGALRDDDPIVGVAVTPAITRELAVVTDAGRAPASAASALLDLLPPAGERSPRPL